MVLTQLHTAEDLERLAADDEDFELVEGVLVSMSPSSFGHADVQMTIGALLRAHVTDHGLGKVVGEAGFLLRREPDTVLAPDVAFVAAERLPKKTSGFVELAPDLVVEIVSPGNSPGDIERKIGIYLQSGVRAVWIVYPDERQVVVHTPQHPPKVFTVSDQIDGGAVLPGLALQVEEIFA